MYRWHKLQWKALMQRKASLPHALLLRGRAGIGKHDFSVEFARALLCAQPSSEGACNQCASCVWFNEGNHPDFRLITPENEDENAQDSVSATKKKTAKKTQISVAQIRQLIDYLSLSSHQVAGKRIILISPADALNLASANALLKMLEEPPVNTLFILVTSKPQYLLATIVSRCQSLVLPIPSKADAISWLNIKSAQHAEMALDFAGGAPLLALQILDQLETSASLTKQLALGAKLDPFVSAPLFLSLGMERALETLQKWTFDLLNCALVPATKVQTRYYTTQVNALQAMCKSVNLSLLLRFQQSLLEAKKTANHPLVNEMQLENILLNYTYIFKS